MTIKDKIVDFMKDKESVSLNELKTNFAEINQNSIWGVIASNKDIFEKVKRGEYKLKD